MARPIMLGNGSLTVGLNEHGLVQDFYYPYVGLDNLTTARSAHHMIGIWVDDRFSWVDDGSWTTVIDFEADALIGHVALEHEELGVKLVLSDFVDSDMNAFCRSVTVTNHSDHRREIRLFMHQVFQISRYGRADTAIFEPEEHYILDYKGRISLLVYGQHASSQKPFDQFAIGNYGIEGKEGTFRDAEDGELSGSAVEHGGVDTVMRFVCDLQPHHTETIDYWIAAGDSQQKVESIHQQIKEDGFKIRREKTREHWQGWLSKSREQRKHIPLEYQDLVSKSLLVIASHIDKRGGVIASCDSSIYNYGRDYYSYVWPRDGAYVMWPLIRLGYTDEPKRFFEFCRDILTPEGYLMHKYQPDRAIGSTWHPMLHGRRKELAIQEDETAIVLYMLGEFMEVTQDRDYIQSLYATLIQPAANFLSRFLDTETSLPHASYDLWEEKFLTTTYTTALVYQSLLVAADFADLFEYPDDALTWRNAAENLQKNSKVFFNPTKQAYRKGYLLKDDHSLYFDDTVDVSTIYAVMMFDYGSIEQLQSSVKYVEEHLLDQSPSGGTPRYEHDSYFASEPAYLGNPWFVTTLWMAQFYVRIGQIDKTKHYLAWVADHALSSGILSEQVNPTTGEIVSVTPLVWSHAEYINTVLDLTKSEHKP